MINGNYDNTENTWYFSSTLPKAITDYVNGWIHKE